MATIHIKKSHRGLLHKNLGVKQGDKIPASKLVVHEGDSPKLRKQKQFAINAKKWNKKAYGGKVKDNSNLFLTDKTAFLDSAINANTNQPWVRDLYNPDAKQPFLEYYGPEDEDQYIVSPNVNHLFVGGGIPFNSEEKAQYFIQNQQDMKTPIPSESLKQRFPKKAFGGKVNVEVEDEEVAETPNGQLIQYEGATHEDGGIDTSLPEGSDTFSSRLSIDGKTMAERKMAREKGLAKLNKLYKTRPVDKLVHNAIKRKTAINEVEEQQDMFVQELAAKYQQPKQKKAYGGGVWEEDNAYENSNINDNQILYPNSNGYIDNITNANFQAGPSSKDTDNIIAANFPAGPTSVANGPNQDSGYGNIGNNTFQPIDVNSEANITAPANQSWKDVVLSSSGGTSAATQVNDASAGGNTPITDAYTKSSPNAPNTAGNIVGMAGTIIGGLAPLINSKQYWKNRIQPTNPYLGFNKDALDTNQNAINQLAGVRELAIAGNKQARTGAINRNSNSTRSLNTLRALNTGTDIAAGNAENQINQGFAAQMANVLDKRGVIQTQRDSAVMSGNKAVQDQNRADVENYYTNQGKDLQNLGTQAQVIGKNMNEQKHNEDFLAILPMLSKYGLGISYVNGKPTLVNTK